MSTLTPSDLRALTRIEQALTRELSLGERALGVLGCDLRALLRAEVFGAYGVSWTTSGIEARAVEIDSARGTAHRKQVMDGLRTYLHRQNADFANYHPLAPEPAQRNRVFTLRQLTRVRSGAPIRTELFPRVGLAGLDQLRVVLCDGAAMVSWFGFLREDDFGLRDQALLRRLVKPVLARLRLERDLGQPTPSALVGSLLDALEHPAFVVRGNQVVHANAQGRERWRDQPEGLWPALRAFRRGEPPLKGFDVLPLTLPGARMELVIQREAGNDHATRVTHRAALWGLTLREEQVLALVAQGKASKRVAAELGCAEGTVELHLTTIYRKAQVENRASLVARFWMQD